MSEVVGKRGAGRDRNFNTICAGSRLDDKYLYIAVLDERSLNLARSYHEGDRASSSKLLAIYIGGRTRPTHEL